MLHLNCKTHFSGSVIQTWLARVKQASKIRVSVKSETRNYYSGFQWYSCLGSSAREDEWAPTSTKPGLSWATISCSVGKSRTTVMWNAMFADAMRYSQKENQLNAAIQHTSHYKLAFTTYGPFCSLMENLPFYRNILISRRIYGPNLKKWKVKTINKCIKLSVSN